jgi:cell division initiation protein
MMDLTPIEVRKKKGDFRRQLRGYDPAQVDDFLDLVADRLEQVVRENMGMVERVTRLEQQVADFRDRERAMTEALVTAQQMRDTMRSQVEKEVELAKRQAVQDADHIRSEATQEAEREEENIRRLRQRQRQLLQSFRAFLERELSDLVVFSKALEVDDSVPDEAPVRSRRSGGRSRGRPAGDDEATSVEDVAGLAEGAAPRGRPDESRVRPYAPPAAEADEPRRPAGRPLPPPVAFPPERATPAARAPEAPPTRAAEPSMRSMEPPARPGARLDAFGEPIASEVAGPDPLDALLGEGPAAVEDRPEPVEAPGAPPSDVAEARTAESLHDVSEEEFGGLFTGWGDAPPGSVADADADAVGEPASEPEPGVTDEEFLDALLTGEPELVLSDEDVLDDAVEGQGGGERAGEPSLGEAEEIVLEEELVLEEEALSDVEADEPRLTGDQAIDLGLLPDSEDLAGLNLDDLGLPPLPAGADDAFGSSGLTLRPLSQEEEAPDVPRERDRERDDDDDMFSSLFGKPR